VEVAYACLEEPSCLGEVGLLALAGLAFLEDPSGDELLEAFLLEHQLHVLAQRDQPVQPDPSGQAKQHDPLLELCLGLPIMLLQRPSSSSDWVEPRRSL
jgi:hypothetical protein